MAPKAPLGAMVIPSGPMQFIAMDIGTFPIDKDGYKHILMIGDIFSKYVAKNTIELVNTRSCHHEEQAPEK